MPTRDDQSDPARPSGDFVRLLTRHQPRIYGYIRALVPNYADAQDLLSETNATLWARYEADSPIDNFGAWACGIARIEVLRYRQKRGRDRLQFSDAFTDTIARQIEAQAPQLDARAEALELCMGELPDPDRQIIELKYHDEAPTAEVANQVGRSTDAIYKALARIRRNLLRCIETRIEREAKR